MFNHQKTWNNVILSICRAKTLNNLHSRNNVGISDNFGIKWQINQVLQNTCLLKGIHWKIIGLYKTNSHKKRDFGLKTPKYNTRLFIV